MRISQYLDLPKKMYNARINAGLSQKYVAEKMEITKQSYSRYENGISEPSIENLEIFCKEVHTTLPELLGIKDPVTEKEPIVSFSEWIYTLKQLEDYVTRILDVAILTTLRLEERSRKNESNDKVNTKTNEKTGKTTKEELKQILRNLQDGEILEIDFSNKITDNNPSEDNQNGE